MRKQITMALLALFLCATSYAQANGKEAPKYASSLLETRNPPAPPEQPKFYRPSGCDTLLTHPTDSTFCTCNCVSFNPKWITDTDERSTGLNIANLTRVFDIMIPPEIFQSGRLIGLDSDGTLFFAMFSMNVQDKIVTTRFTWRYMCRSGAFFFEGVTRKMYAKE